MPQYLTKFTCIGTDCEDTCCAGWRVDIDRATYKRYNAVRDPELAPLLNMYVRRNRQNPNPLQYAYIELMAGARCSFLTQDNLCSIQQRLGEDHLSTLCAVYPRLWNELNGLTEKSLSPSCPEAARLILLDRDGLVFTQATEAVDVPSIVDRRIDTKAEAAQGSVYQFLWELRIFSIQLLQDRTYALPDRLILLGMFFAKVDQYIAAGTIDQIPDLIGSYSVMFKDGAAKDQLAAIPSKDTLQMVLLKELTDERFSLGILQGGRYYHCLLEFLQGLGWDGETTADELGQRYREAYTQYYAPFMAEHEYMLENYLVNQAFRWLFPYHAEKSPFQVYGSLVLAFALIKMHLIGIAAHHKGLTPELVIRMVQAFAKEVEHNSVALKRMEQLLIDNGYMNLASMAILLKN